MRTTKAVLMAAMLSVSGCADDGGEPVAEVDGTWNVVASIECLAEPVAISFTVDGDSVEVADPIAGEAIASTDWDEWKTALTVITESGTRWVIQVDAAEESAAIWYSDGECSVGAVPAVSVERN